MGIDLQTSKDVAGRGYLNDYDIAQFQYPSDLDTSPEYGGHRVMFFINVLAAGQISRTDKYDLNTMPIPEGEQTSYLDKAKSSNQADRLKSTLGGMLPAEAQSMLTVLAPKRRLKAAVSLYVPNALTTSYSVNWGEGDLDEMTSGETKLRYLMGAMDQSKNASGTQNVAKTFAGSTAAKIMNGQQYLQKAIGLAPGQSKAQQLFKNVDFRDFSFQYEFAPKSESEAAKVLNIIRLLRHHMLPEYFDTEQYLYIYPSEFEIRHYSGSVENPYLEKYATAVLTGMTINYTPNGQHQTFANGMPTHINIDMRFKELSTPSKETSPSNDRGI